MFVDELFNEERLTAKLSSLLRERRPASAKWRMPTERARTKAAQQIMRAAGHFLIDEEILLNHRIPILSDRNRERVDKALMDLERKFNAREQRKLVLKVFSIAHGREDYKVTLKDLKRGSISLDHALQKVGVLETLSLGYTISTSKTVSPAELQKEFADRREQLTTVIDAYLQSRWARTEKGPKERSHWLQLIRRVGEIYTALTGNKLSHSIIYPSKEKQRDEAAIDGLAVGFARICLDPLWPGISTGQIQHLIRDAQRRRRKPKRSHSTGRKAA